MLKQIIFALLFLGIAVNAKVTEEKLVAANLAVTEAIALENQCVTSGDCSTLAIGARACGGPSSYLVYATKSSNAENIRSLAQITVELGHQYNRENSVMSICSMVMPPATLCDETHKCVAGSRFGGFGSESI